MASAEDFWNDHAHASVLMKEREGLADIIMRVESIPEQLDDALELIQISNDDEMQELALSVASSASDVEELRKETLFAGDYDDHNTIITIRAGAGGDDAQDWSEMLLKMYLSWIETQGGAVTLIERTDGTIAGIKSVSLKVTLRRAYGLLRSEHGVHRLVRLSPFNSDNLRQTSFAQVEILPLIDALPEVEIEPDDLRIDTFRSSGAGGQSVNTTDSAVRITHVSSGLIVSCQNERSQLQNKEQAMELLRAKLHQKYLQEEEQRQSALRGERSSGEWGSQIRSYVMHPYKLVKDHRNKHETAQVDAVLAGEIDEFIEAYLFAQR